MSHASQTVRLRSGPLYRRLAVVFTASVLCVGGLAGSSVAQAAARGSRVEPGDPVAGQLAYVAVPGAFGTPNALAVMDTRTDSIVDVHTLPQSLNALAVDPAGTEVYAVTQGSVVVIDPATDATLGTIAVGGNNRAVAFNPSGTKAYVTDADGTGSVDVIDTATRTVTATIAAGGHDIALNPAGTLAYAGSATGTLSVIDTATNSVVTDVACGTSTGAVAVNSAGTRVYVADTATRDICAIDTATNNVVATVALPAGSNPTDVVLNPAGTLAYVSTAPAGRVYVIDLQTNAIAGSFPYSYGVAEALNTAGTSLFVAGDNPMNPSGGIAAFDTGSDGSVGGAKVEGEPADIAMGPAAPGTAVSLAVSPAGAATQGNPVTLTATVSGATSGTVQFFDTASSALGAVPLGAPVPVTNGTATFRTTTLSVDTHALNAAFIPSQTGLLRSASAPVTVQVTPSGVRIDQTVAQDGTGTVTTAPLSTSGSRLLLALVGSDGPAGQATTVTGAGLHWTLVQRADSQNGSAEVWSAVAPGPLTGATVTSTPQADGFDQHLTVVALTGASGVGASSAAGDTAGTEKVSLTTTAPDSQVFGVGEDPSNAQARTPGSGQHLLGQWVDTASGDTFWTQTTNAPTPAANSTVTLTETAPTGDVWNMAAVEILAAGS